MRDETPRWRWLRRAYLKGTLADLYDEIEKQEKEMTEKMQKARTGGYE
jgi:hypothetical protein